MDSGKEQWMTCSSAVYNYSKKNIKGRDKNGQYPGDEVDVQYTENNGQFNCNRVSKKAGTTSSKQGNSTKPTCADCGKELKDDKYEKCYSCNQKNPTSKSDSTQDAINRQNANHATSRALIALQGHVDPNNISELIDMLHKKFMEKITG